MMSDSDPKISYTVRELIQEMRKETKESLERLETKVDAIDKSLDERIKPLENAQTASAGVSQFKAAVIPMAVSILCNVAGWIIYWGLFR